MAEHGVSFFMPGLSNWGRWGPDDEIGTANYITPEVIIHAAKLVRKGKVFSCAIPIENTGPVFPTRIPPQHVMTRTGADFTAGAKGRGTIPEGGMKSSDDYIYMGLQSSTQWDSLAHAWYGEYLYNGFSQNEIKSVREGGARRNGIDKMYRHFVSRGVLLDIAGFKGMDRLPAGYAIGPEELEACAQAENVEIRSGDILLLRTGHVPWFYKLTDKHPWLEGWGGIGKAAVPWLHEKQIAAIAADNLSVEVYPPEDEGAYMPLHCVLIRDLGLTLGEIFQFEELAADCREDGVYECLFVGAPLRVTGGVGSPLNPLAIK